MRTLNYEPRFIGLATVINGSMPEYTARRVAETLNLRRKALNGARILVLGVAYKPNVSDFRESPALDVMSHLLRARARVSYHDPHVPAVTAEGLRLRSKPLTDKALRSADLVAILTAHRDIDYAKVLRCARLVFDARNATSGLAADGRLHRL
jgi:UDP-N-acetyl-D-glucosamine dehydrogenase